MNRYLLPLAATLVVSGIGFVACGPQGNCSPANCGGCCDSAGMCITSTTASACGRLGEMCTSCSGATNVCSMGVCTAGTTGGGGGSMGGGAGGGTGGGTTGGGTGGGTTGGGTGGGAPACVAFDFSQAISGPARYTEPAPGQMGTPNHQSYVFQPSAVANRFDILAFESWYFGPNSNPTFPQTTMVPGPAGASYADCAQCITLDEACDGSGQNCARSYYVQGGTLVINTATRNTVAGQFQLTATNLTMKEWVFGQTSDMEAPNARCITIATVSLDAGWAPAPVDGGTDAGVNDAGVTDAGTDAGIIDAGVDAGIEVDAGVDAGLDDAGIDAGP